MVAITDILKLRPELVKLPKAELLRQRTEYDMAIDFVEAEEKEEKRKIFEAEAQGRVDAVVEGLKWMKDNDLLFEDTIAHFSRADGVFQPHNKLNVRPKNATPAQPAQRKKRQPKI